MPYHQDEEHYSRSEATSTKRDTLVSKLGCCPRKRASTNVVYKTPSSAFEEEDDEFSSATDDSQVCSCDATFKYKLKQRMAHVKKLLQQLEARELETQTSLSDDLHNKPTEEELKDNKLQKTPPVSSLRLPGRQSSSTHVQFLSRKPTYYVITTSHQKFCANYDAICTYISILEKDGFEFEIERTLLQEDLLFLTITAPNEVLEHFAEMYDVDLMCNRRDIPIHFAVKAPFRFMETELTRPNIDGPVFKRCPHTISGEPPHEITTAEVAMVVSKMLSVTRFGDEFLEVGIDNMIKKGMFEKAYPLHDGDWEWTKEGPLNDRQLLAKYWAEASCWYKQQPLDLIQKYYGTEVAFYFAWVGFYNKMLIPASILGILCFIYGLVTVSTTFNHRSPEICNSSRIMCPRCREEYCKFSYLSKSCGVSVMTYLCDNEATVFFAVMMSFWAATFVQLWKREQALLQLRWNVTHVEADLSERPEFARKATKWRQSAITGDMELYVPPSEKCVKYVVTISSIFFLMIFVVIVFLTVMIYQMSLMYWLSARQENVIAKKSMELIATTIASVFTVVFIMLFEMAYRKIAVFLTDMENPRTQSAYDNSFIYKCYALAFVNNYAITFYIAFFKGRFYTHPGEVNGGIRSDLCDPAGCTVNLCIQLVSVAVIKYIFMNVVEVVLPMLKVTFKKIRTNTLFEDETNKLKNWERDYVLNPANIRFLISEYSEMVIQYGYVIFFVAVFPLAPFLAFISNIAEIRIDAQKFLMHNQRAVPKKVSGIGAWNGILQYATYLGIVTNAFVIAFTSTLVPREVYRYTKRSSLVGFVNSTLSEFDVKDGHFAAPSEGAKYCYYPGKRYPPQHLKRYHLTKEYWIELLIRFIVVVVFEHMVMIIAGILAYAIPDIPHSVRDYLNHQRIQWKERRRRGLNDTFKQKQKSKPPSLTPSFKDQSMVLIDEAKF